MKLKDLPLVVKISFFWFYVLTIMGFIFAFLIVENTVSHFPLHEFLQRLVDYYRGNPERMVFGKSNLELAEISHFHSFISSLVILTIAIFFSQTEMSERTKLIVINIVFLGVVLFIFSPWIIKLFPALSIIKPISSLMFLPGVIFMGLKVLKDMFL